MSAGARFPIERVHPLAEKLQGRLTRYCERILVAGSIRRLRPTAKDIDLVAIPRDRSGLGLLLYSLTGQKLDVTKQIVRFSYCSVPVDLYLCSAENFVITALIRTGSAEHNRWLATRALRMGKRLNFAQGIVAENGVATSVLLEGDTDIGDGELVIFVGLDLPNIPPSARELGAPHTLGGMK